MARVIIKNPENKVHKIPLTKLLQSEADMRLDTAKYATDDLLEKGSVEISFDSNDKAKRFIKKSEEFGVICEFVVD